MAKFDVTVTRQYEFKGNVTIEADTREEAQAMAAVMISDIPLAMGNLIEGEDTVDGINVFDLSKGGC